MFGWHKTSHYQNCSAQRDARDISVTTSHAILRLLLFLHKKAIFEQWCTATLQTLGDEMNISGAEIESFQCLHVHFKAAHHVNAQLRSQEPLSKETSGTRRVLENYRSAAREE